MLAFAERLMADQLQVTDSRNRPRSLTLVFTPDRSTVPTEHQAARRFSPLHTIGHGAVKVPVGFMFPEQLQRAAILLGGHAFLQFRTVCKIARIHAGIYTLPGEVGGGNRPHVVHLHIDPLCERGYLELEVAQVRRQIDELAQPQGDTVDLILLQTLRWLEGECLVIAPTHRAFYGRIKFKELVDRFRRAIAIGLPVGNAHKNGASGWNMPRGERRNERSEGSIGLHVGVLGLASDKSQGPDKHGNYRQGQGASEHTRPAERTVHGGAGNFVGEKKKEGSDHKRESRGAYCNDKQLLAMELVGTWTNVIEVET